MKNENWMLWLRKLLVPGMLALLGFAIVVAPDWAAALASKVLGWVLIAVGVMLLIAGAAFFKERFFCNVSKSLGV